MFCCIIFYLCLFYFIFLIFSRLFCEWLFRHFCAWFPIFWIHINFLCILWLPYYFSSSLRIRELVVITTIISFNDISYPRYIPFYIVRFFYWERLRLTFLYSEMDAKNLLAIVCVSKCRWLVSSEDPEGDERKINVVALASAVMHLCWVVHSLPDFFPYLVFFCGPITQQTPLFPH